MAISEKTVIRFLAWHLDGDARTSISGDKLPLVVVSHGDGGSMLAHHDAAEMLVDAGLIVGAIDHPGDSSSDLSRVTDLSANRP